MNLKGSSVLIFSLLVFAPGCGPSSDSRQREAEIAELKIANSNLQAELQQMKLQITNQSIGFELARKQAEAYKLQQAAQESVSKQKDAAQNIVKELLKLQAITETGVSYSQYTERLLDASTTIKLSLPFVGDQNFSLAVSEILSAYLDAQEFWLSAIKYPSVSLHYSEKEKYQKYIPNDHLAASFQRPGDVTYFWSFATDHIENLEKTFPELLK